MYNMYLQLSFLSVGRSSWNCQSLRIILGNGSWFFLDVQSLDDFRAPRILWKRALSFRKSTSYSFDSLIFIAWSLFCTNAFGWLQVLHFDWIPCRLGHLSYCSGSSPDIWFRFHCKYLRQRGSICCVIQISRILGFWPNRYTSRFGAKYQNESPWRGSLYVPLDLESYGQQYRIWLANWMNHTSFYLHIFQGSSFGIYTWCLWLRRSWPIAPFERWIDQYFCTISWNTWYNRPCFLWY